MSVQRLGRRSLDTFSSTLPEVGIVTICSVCMISEQITEEEDYCYTGAIVAAPANEPFTILVLLTTRCYIV